MQKLEELKNYLNSNFVELDHAIKAILLGLTAKAHVFLLPTRPNSRTSSASRASRG
jgi:hypothetical protein